MKSYSIEDVSCALEKARVKKGDLVFLSMRVFSIGRLEGYNSREAFNKAYLDAIFDIIGEKGTLVVPTYSQQIGRFGLPYIHEETPTLTGVFSEFIRTCPGAVRSFHPVFSLTALGYHAQEICGEVGTSGFGAQSAYDHLFKHGGHSICLGFTYESGHIVTGAHYIECSYSVPYYYNKVLKSKVYKGGQQSNKIFTLNVGYRDFDIKINYIKYIEALHSKGLLKSHAVGSSVLYSSRLEDQLRVGYELLSEDTYSFLEHPPCWKEGVIPFEGSSEKIEIENPESINWNGFRLQAWGKQWK